MTVTLPSFIACATCIPNSDARVALAGNSAILFMLITLMIVLGSVFSFIIYLSRRARNSGQLDDTPSLPTSQ